jgi:hypothetical protein
VQKLQGYSQIQATGARVATATITVYNNGTLTLATIYSDNLNTPLSNPFTSDANGLWFFYAANGRYDVQMSGGSPTISPAYTLSDFLLENVLTVGSWTPAATNLTSIGGSPTITGTYSVMGNAVFFTITVTPVTSTASTGDLTFFSLSPLLPVIRPTVCMATDNNGANLGTGVIEPGVTGVFPPTWNSTANVYISGVYELS